MTFQGVSVILCCYNSATRLSKTLEYLAAQKVTSATQWELIIINNNSTDATKDEAIRIWQDLGSSVPFQVVDEARPGLSFAREKGMSEAQYDIFLFCDDDNWLQATYVEQVYTTFNTFPELGALGGWCSAVFEGDKPDWFDTFAGNFAVGKPMTSTGYLTKANDYIYGAGMALSIYAVQHLKQKGFKNILSDRKGTALSSGGDVELIYAIKLVGYKVMYDEALFFNHFMPNGRMTWDYLLKLRQSMYWSNFVLNIYTDAIKQVPINLVTMLKRILKSLKYIYIENKRLKTMDIHKALFLKNQIAVKTLFLKHPWFYYQTRLSLKKIQND